MISSRTPEGSPNQCPVCGQQVCLEPTLPSGDAPCPNCGHLLWFVVIGEKWPLVFDAELPALRERVLQVLAKQLGVSAEQLRADPHLFTKLGGDSLDLVELVMALEEE